MGQEAEAEADADEQLRRRLRRVFAAEERSFRMDRRSPVAVALCSAVADVLPRFLDNYSDDTLAEYIVILVCNGKHQYQARDDLEAFLGDNSAKFVAWLWGYLSKNAVASADNSNVQNGLPNESQNLNDKKNVLLTKTQHGDTHIINSKILASQEHHGLQTLDSTKRSNVAPRRISSTVISSPERLVGDQYYWEDQHPKKVWSATGGRSSSVQKSGIAAGTGHALTQQESNCDGHEGGITLTRHLPVAVGTHGGELPGSTKRRRNVWDRLGKPRDEDHGLASETGNMHVENREHKKTKLTVAEQEQRRYVYSTIGGGLFEKANSRKFSSNNSDINAVQEHEHTVKSNRSRLIGRLSFGDVERNHHQIRDVSEFTSEGKSSCAAVSEPGWHDNSKSSKEGHASASNELSQFTMRINSGTGVLQSQQMSSPLQSNSESSLREDGGNHSNKPVKDEMLDMKLKLKQIEQEMLKLRSKQVQINNGKQGALQPGPHSNLEEDADSRTVLVTNVHFAATKESLSTHFMKCGTVLKINVLSNAITGHPKGAAYITFADKESIGRAISLSGTSFLSRVLTVLRKAEAPPGFLASVQQTGRPLQPWNSPPFQKGLSPMQSSIHHLQWKREQSALEISPANCPTN